MHRMELWCTTTHPISSPLNIRRHQRNFAAYASSTSNSGSQPTLLRLVLSMAWLRHLPCTRTRSFNDSSGTLRSYSLTFAQFQTAILNNASRLRIQSRSLREYFPSGRKSVQLHLRYGKRRKSQRRNAHYDSANWWSRFIYLRPARWVRLRLGLGYFDHYGGGTWNLAFRKHIELPAHHHSYYASSVRFRLQGDLSDKTVFMTVPHGDLYPFLQPPSSIAALLHS